MNKKMQEKHEHKHHKFDIEKKIHEVDEQKISNNRDIDDVNETVTELMSMAITENGNTDSKVGWSSAFFALVITMLVTIGAYIDNQSTWIIIYCLLAPLSVSTLLILIALTPHTKEFRKRTKNVDLEKIIETEIDDLLDAERDRRFEIIENKKRYAIGLYVAQNRKMTLIKWAYYISFPFLWFFS